MSGRLIASESLFVFLDDDHLPFCVRRHANGQWWIYYWNEGPKTFVTLRKIELLEAVEFLKRSLPLDQQQLYLDKALGIKPDESAKASKTVVTAILKRFEFEAKQLKNGVPDCMMELDIFATAGDPVRGYIVLKSQGGIGLPMLTNSGVYRVTIEPFTSEASDGS